jgi:endonuclease VIII
MPEGDALHRIAERLQVLVGERVEASSPHPRGLATNVARVIDGRVLESVQAVGKHLLLRFEGNVTLRSHLRLNGRWRVEPRRERPRAGLPWLVLRTEHWEATQWNGPVLAIDAGRARRRLGPDLLADDTTVEELATSVRKADASRLVGDVLLDQRIVAGIGNMWLAELLWHAAVSPWLPVGRLTDNELLDALTWAKAAMRRSVAGERAARVVYRRAGRPCPRCGATIRARGLGDMNRTAYWCEACQRSS